MHQSRVLLIILGTSCVMGVVAYSKYRSSEKILWQDLAHFRQIGTQLSSEECINEVIEWRNNCLAMKSLCDISVPRMMETCLASQNREKYCVELGTIPSDTHFGFKECQNRHLNSKTKKACAASYRIIDSHCKHILMETKR